MGIGYYDREGNKITEEEYMEKMKGKDNHIAEDVLDNGKHISTIWLGMDHRHGQGVPLIFETMVFPSEDEWGEIDCVRTSSKEQAKVEHENMVEKYKGEDK